MCENIFLGNGVIYMGRAQNLLRPPHSFLRTKQMIADRFNNRPGTDPLVVGLFGVVIINRPTAWV